MIPDCSAFSRIILVVNKRLTIKSENSSAYCIVNGGGTWADVFTLEADGIRIEGFTITGGRYGIHIRPYNNSKRRL